MTMNNNEKPAFLRGKGAAFSLVICFAAVIVLVGAYTFSNYRNDMEGQAAKAEEQAEELTEEISEWEMAAEDPAEEAAADEIVLPETESTQTADEDAADGMGVDGDTGKTVTYPGTERRLRRMHPGRRKSGLPRTAPLPGRPAAR